MELFVALDDEPEQDGPYLPSSQLPHSQPPSASQEARFVAATTTTRHLADVFGLITPVSKEAVITIGNDGMRIYAELEHRLSNLLVTVDSTVFRQWQLTPPNATLKLQLDISLIALALLSVPNDPEGKHTCIFSYDGLGSPFVIEFDDNLISERIEMHTYVHDIDDGSHVLGIDRSRVHFEITLDLKTFTALLESLHNVGTTEVSLNISNTPETDIRHQLTGGNHNSLFFVSKGPIGLMKVIYPGMPTVLERVDIYDDSDNPTPITSQVLLLYSFKQLGQILKAVRLSSKCKLVKDYRGVLLLQLLCRNQSNATLMTYNLVELSNVEIVYDDEPMVTVEPHSDQEYEIERGPAFDTPIFL